MDMLRGSKNANMHQYLTTLSTYGILSDLTDARMKALFRAMQEGGLLQSSGGELPLLTLSAKGEDVMKEKAPARLVRRGWSKDFNRKPKAAAFNPRGQQLLTNIMSGRMDKELYSHLSELRRDLAAEFRMPVYRILNTETMRAMATVKPTTIEAAARLKGIGPWTRQTTLRAFVELIQDYEGV